MELAVVLHASNREDAKLKIVEGILKMYMHQYFIYGDTTWKGFGEKLHTIYKACKELVEYDNILFIDAYDVIVLGDTKDILDRFYSINKPLVFSSEVNCWSGGVDSVRALLHPVCNTPWKYLNSGSYIGNREYLLSKLEEWKIYNIPYNYDDQKYFMDKFLEDKNSINLDTNCVLFQSLLGSMHLLEFKNKTVKNTYTNTSPLILHHNGGGDIKNLEYIWK